MVDRVADRRRDPGHRGLAEPPCEFLELAQILPNYLDVSSITVHYTIADGDRVAACVGIVDVATGKLTRFIEQFTVKDGKIVENQLFYNDAGTLADKAKIG